MKVLGNPDNHNVTVKINKEGEYSSVLVDGIRMKAITNLQINEDVGAFVTATITVILKDVIK